MTSIHRKRRYCGELLESRRLLTKLADLDADGDLDAVRSGSWYENVDGQGDFTEHPFVGLTADNAEVHVADLDSDGDEDVVLPNGQWLKNIDGRGNFGVEDWNPTAAAFDAVRVHDNGQDGDMDLIATIGRSYASLLQNDGAGVFPFNPPSMGRSRRPLISTEMVCWIRLYPV
jgi:hypothetical protein